VEAKEGKRRKAKVESWHCGRFIRIASSRRAGLAMTVQVR